MAKIIMFHGAECPHCRAMMPVVDKLTSETDVDVEKKEVWHNEANADEMRAHQDVIIPACGGSLGVPTFYNPEADTAICGEVPYEKLKEWANSKEPA